ncbi:hypothetical protein TWF718_008324 [Orbilia javanica]|uniref:Uncharacterized protein n=1 Tax=Orbilia javanica TaxID=47235 RepID=A0AAN8MRM6_9PEZI
MRIFHLIGATIFLSDLSFTTAFPASDLIEPIRYLEKRLWLADLPPIEPTIPGGVYHQRDQVLINRLIDHGDGPYCVLALLATSRGNVGDQDRWIGWPLGNATYRYKGENKCQNFKDLHKMIPNQVSSYQVTGYCECEFFDKPNCEDGKFRAFNRADDSLRIHGNNDILESYRCWTEMHMEKAGSCLVFYGPTNLRRELTSMMGKSNLDGDDVKIKPPFTMATISKDMMFLDGPGSKLRCYRLEPATIVEAIVVRSCSCVFYLNDDCTMPLSNPQEGDFSVGNAGWDIKAAKGDYDKVSFGTLRSFTCGPPYGVSSYTRFWDLPG